MVIWWSRGDLNPRLALVLRCLQANCWHNAVILVMMHSADNPRKGQHATTTDYPELH